MERYNTLGELIVKAQKSTLNDSILENLRIEYNKFGFMFKMHACKNEEELVNFEHIEK